MSADKSGNAIKEAAAKIAEKVAKNCGSVPQLTFPHIYLGLEEFAAAFEAAPQQAQAPGWQPIETAPKDGRTVQLGYFNSHGKWRSLRGQWMSAEYIAEYWEEPDDGEPGWYETSVEKDDTPNCWRTEPTHWAPLLSAPQQGDKTP